MVRFAPAVYERPDPEGERRRRIVRILQAALGAVDPAVAVRRHVQRRGDTLQVGDVAGPPDS